jgi:hypothetical protein
LIAAGIALAIISAANSVGTALKAKFGVISSSLKRLHVIAGKRPARRLPPVRRSLASTLKN